MGRLLMETRNFFVEKAKADGMKPEENKIKVNQLGKGIKESINERIMALGT